MSLRFGRPDAPVRITLSCGCTIRARLPPIGTNGTYGCRSALGHGYRLRWTSWIDDGERSHANRALEREAASPPTTPNTPTSQPF
ncbi:hypothetical protein [Kitasatospora sp. NPDC088548]|uniref:hypothetical protein n=1 Tax=Kitasatospora sp. NPDC088548 TaxID=3364075 RepID=UPI0037FB408F